MPKTLTESDARIRLIAHIAESAGMYAWCREHSLSRQRVHYVLTKRKPLPDSMLKVIGLKRVTTSTIREA